MNKALIIAVLAMSSAVYPGIGISAYAASNRHMSSHLPAPRLSPAYPDELAWKWNHPNPYKWNVYISTDGVSFFLPEDYWMYGDARRFAPDGGSERMFIVGVDEAGNAVTGRSNIVRPEDARVPKGKGSSSGKQK